MSFVKGLLPPNSLFACLGQFDQSSFPAWRFMSTVYATNQKDQRVSIIILFAKSHNLGQLLL